jgi:hypothetical protein
MNKRLLVLVSSMLAVSVFIGILGIGIYLLSIDLQSETEYRNILFIVADDLGWSDVGYGDSEALTPTIDTLAREGIKLDFAYTYSMCTP